MGDQRHAPAALTPRERESVPTVYEAGRAQVPVVGVTEKRCAEVVMSTLAALLRAAAFVLRPQVTSISPWSSQVSFTLPIWGVPSPANIQSKPSFCAVMWLTKIGTFSSP